MAPGDRSAIRPPPRARTASRGRRRSRRVRPRPRRPAPRAVPFCPDTRAASDPAWRYRFRRRCRRRRRRRGGRERGIARGACAGAALSAGHWGRARRPVAAARGGRSSARSPSRRARPSTPVPAYASSTARTVFVGTAEPVGRRPPAHARSRVMTAARRRGSARARGPATSAFSSRTRDALRLNVAAEPRILGRRDEGEPLVVRLEDLAPLVEQVAPGGVVLGHARVQDEVVGATGDRERIELDRAEPAEDLEHGVRLPPSSDRAGASAWRATRKRRAVSAVTFTQRTLAGGGPGPSRSVDPEPNHDWTRDRSRTTPLSSTRAGGG